MKHFSLNLETMSPLAIRADHAPGGVENAGYISGTTLLGSLAALHRLAHPGDTVAFEQLFLSGQVYYPDLYPSSFKHDELQDATLLPIYSLPKTAQSCKRYPGFKPEEGKEKDDDDGHGARDSLMDWAILALADLAQRNGQAIDWKALLKPLQIRKFVMSVKSQWIVSPAIIAAAPWAYGEIGAETRLQTRTGINRETGTVQESILYSRQVFQEHARFRGNVHVEEFAPGLQKFIGEVAYRALCVSVPAKAGVWAR